MPDLHPYFVEEHDHGDMPRQLDQAEHAEREGGTHREREFIHAREDTRPEGERLKTPCEGWIQLFLKPGDGLDVALRSGSNATSSEKRAGTLGAIWIGKPWATARYYSGTPARIAVRL
jgi:hypothetical protein